MSITDRVKQFFRWLSLSSPMAHFGVIEPNLNQGTSFNERMSERRISNINPNPSFKENDNQKETYSSDFPKDISIMFPHLPMVAHKILTLAESWIPVSTRSSHSGQGLRDRAFSICNTESNKFSSFSQIALASATQQVLTLPKDIQVIVNAFWKHAFYAASLAEKLAQHLNHLNVNQAHTDLPTVEDLDPELCYLLGFTHNFGFLLFGYLFRHEFRLLNKWMHQYPNEPIEKLEKRLLGMGNALHVVGGGHAQLGAWLMEYWNMPEPFILVAGLHHQKDYQGPYSKPIALIQLTNYLLKTMGIGEGAHFSEKILLTLGISQNSAETILQGLLLETEDLYLEQMARECTN